MLKKEDGVWTGFFRLGKGPLTGSRECDNEPSGFIKCRDLLD
jgi:hypothetical protein